MKANIQKQITQKTIADKLGVHVTTVSMALRDSPAIRAELRKQIKETAKELGYRPSHAGKALRFGKTHMIGMILPDFNNPFYVELLKGVQAVCSYHGYSLISMDYNLDIKQERNCLERMLGRQCDGIITIPSRFEPVKDLIEEFWNSRLPCVTLGVPHDIGKVKIDSVRVDLAKGMEAAVDHLVALGHQHIVFAASWPREIGARMERFGGFESGLRKNGLPFNSGKNICYYFTGNQLEDGKYLGKEILRAYPEATAIIGTNDYLAIGLMQSLTSMGVRVPEDISLVGADNTWIGRNWSVPLTSIDQKTDEMAKAASELLFERMKCEQWDEPRHILLDAALAVRASTGHVCTKESSSRHKRKETADGIPPFGRAKDSLR